MLLSLSRSGLWQVLATLACLESAEFAQAWLGQDHAYGTIPRSKINPNGSSIALDRCEP